MIQNTLLDVHYFSEVYLTLISPKRIRKQLFLTVVISLVTQRVLIRDQQHF